MQYNSTRDSGVSVSAAQAIAQGISHEGGLFVGAGNGCVVEIPH